MRGHERVCYVLLDVLLDVLFRFTDCMKEEDSPELDTHEVKDVATASDENEFHDGVIEGDPVAEYEVEITC